MTIKREVFDSHNVTNSVDPTDAVSGQESEQEKVDIRDRRDLVCDEEVLDAVTNQPKNGTDEEDDPERQIDSCNAGEPTKELASIRSKGKVVELELGHEEKLFELGRVSWEI